MSEAAKYRAVRIWAVLGASVALAWLLAYLIPDARMLDLDMALSFLLGLWVAGLLGWAARHSQDAALFWRLLFAAWLVALLGNVAWGAYEAVTGKTLPIFSLVDGFYVSRYGLLLAAFWRYPSKASRGHWWQLVSVLLVATFLTWLLLFRPNPQAADDSLLIFLGGALYPALDVVLLYAALGSRMRATGRMRGALTFLALALVVYGVANWINFGVRVASFEASSSLTGFFWPLSDILSGLGVLWALW